MTRARAPVLLLGPAGGTAPVAEGLAERGWVVRTHERPEPFLADALAHGAAGVLLWDGATAGDGGTLLEVLSHHFPGGECAVFRVRGRAAPEPREDPRIRAELVEPVDPEAVSALLGRGGVAEGAAKPGIPRILVVDDDPNIVYLGSHVVTGMGMIPLVAFDGVEALEKASTLRPDLVLLDINMPAMDGFEVIERLKAEPATNLIPIIVFSARKDEDDKVRALNAGADDYVTKPFSISELAARVDRLLQRTRAGMSASSTTGLPGSLTLDRLLAGRLEDGDPLAVLYVDADHFKSFNDRYGFARGDGVIRQTADLLLETVRRTGNREDFVGHIGGDDFIAITTPDRAQPIAEALIEAFDRIIPFYYDPADRERGGIETRDRVGRHTVFPLMSLSIAVVTNEVRPLRHTAEVADVAAQLKKFAKSKPGSVWVKDQRVDGEGGEP